MLIALVAGGLAAVCLSRGVGASPDSIQYMHYARILLGREPAVNEDGLSVAVTHYPPLYPGLLAAVHLASFKLLTAAAIVNVLCFGLSAGTAAWIARRCVASRPRAIVAAVFVATQPALVSVQLWAVSEPPFLLFLLILIALLVEYRSGRAGAKWVAAGIGGAMACCVLTRYVGLALVPAALWIIYRTPSRSASWKDALRALAVAMTPFVAIAVVQRLIGGSVGHRSIEYHPLSLNRWLDLLQTFAGWLAAPDLLGRAAPYLAVGIAVVMFALVGRNGRRSGVGGIVAVLSVAYVAFLLVSVAFFDNATPLDDRMLSPVAVLVALWLAVDLPLPWRGTCWRSRAITGATALAALAVLVSQIARDAPSVAALRDTGLGFNHVRYRTSPLVKACRALPEKSVIYSNYPEAIWLHTQRSARILPGRPAAEFGREGVPLADQLALVADRLHDGGFVAYFKFRQSKRPSITIIPIDELNAVVPLKLTQRTPDGSLYKTATP